MWSPRIVCSQGRTTNVVLTKASSTVVLVGLQWTNTGQFLLWMVAMSLFNTICYVWLPSSEPKSCQTVSYALELPGARLSSGIHALSTYIANNPDPAAVCTLKVGIVERETSVVPHHTMMSPYSVHKCKHWQPRFSAYNLHNYNIPAEGRPLKHRETCTVWLPTKTLRSQRSTWGFEMWLQ